MNHRSLPPQRGIALVVVLVFLVLLSVFVVGFFSNSQDELAASQSFTSAASASHLAESAVAVVMGQVRDATSRTNGAWASQPGMIRVYRSGNAASDRADAFFKLYSSDDMIVSGGEIGNFDPTRDVAVGAGQGWNYNPALWTNLNEPVFTQLPNSNNRIPRYPILDPALERNVEGLEFPPVPGDDSNSRLNDTRARMPVRWIYVLRDGTLTVPTSSGANGSQAIWTAGAKAPSPTNPIVGRIAFWTDDETSKVNINTAGGYSLRPETATGDGGMPARDGENQIYTEDSYAGSFWDTPRAFTEFERGRIESAYVYDPDPAATSRLLKGGLALCQPVRGEFQRYPGHPSTTSLGILFRTPPANRGMSMQDAPYLLTSGQLALLTPRLQYALFPKSVDDFSRRCSSYGTERLRAYNDRPPDLRVKRLYASVDEMFYAQPDIQPGAAARNRREQSDVELFPNNMKSGDDARTVTPSLLEKMRFFLTAHSRAPEMNLFGRPRMTIWPVREVVNQAQESDLWNASDRLIAFCSTIGQDSSRVSPPQVTKFIFQRKDWTSPTVDANIPRNQFLYRYLQELTSQPFPGFGRSFESKYGRTDRDQILTEIFDYIRVVNLRDSTRDLTIVPNLRSVTNPDGVAPTTPQFQRMESYKFAPRGLVVPLRIGDATGFGRFPGISEASLVIYHAGYEWDGGPNTRRFLASEGPRDSAGKVLRPRFDLVRAFLILETYNPMQGFAPLVAPDGRTIDANRRSIVYEIRGLDQFKINGESLGFPANDTTGRSSDGATNYVNHSSTNFWNGRNTGGYEGFFHTLYKPIVSDSATPTAFRNGINFRSDNWNRGFIDFPLENPTDHRFYQFQSISNHPTHPGIKIEIPPTDGVPRTMQLGGARLSITFYFGNPTRQNRINSTPIELTFPDAPAIPVPNGGDLRLLNADPFTGPEWRDPNAYRQNTPGAANNGGGFIPPPDFGNGRGGENRFLANVYEVPERHPSSPYTIMPSYAKSFAGRMFWMRTADSNNYRDVTNNRVGPIRSDMWIQILQPGDVIRSVVFTDGDLRSSMLATDNTIFKPHPDYQSSTLFRAHSLRAANGALYFGDTRFGNIAKLPAGTIYPAGQAADLPPSVNGVTRPDGQPGDFDTGIGNLADGPFCNKPDEGNLAYKRRELDINGDFWRWHFPTPYFTWVYEETFDTFFTPNRQVPSAVLFGSLLAGKQRHWQTLCFSPNPAGQNHPGRQEPRDYLWLDLFHMPIVEPYAISEPFSTAGKINMNYQIVPFANIKRSTGLRAALQPVRITAFSVQDFIPGTNPRQLSYKTGQRTDGSTPLVQNYRYLVDRDETLKAFDDFFAEYNTNRNGGFFKSAAQICDMYLYPKRANAQTLPQVPNNLRWVKGDTQIRNWWLNQQQLTGDNLREKPYADLYARLTTKSNTFCVHVRAQTLRQSAPSDPRNADAHYRVWNENRDKIVGEYRGSSIIERYIDPQDERFYSGDRTTRINVDTDSIERAYRFRVLNTRRFDP